MAAGFALFGPGVAGAAVDGWPDAAVATYSQEAGVSTAEAERRLAVQNRAGDIVDALRDALKDGYAGVWIDRASGRLKVAIAPTTNEAALAAVLKDKGIERDADTVTVHSTWQQLTATKDRWVERVASLLAKQQAMVGIDPSRNAVAVDLSSEADRSEVDSARSQAQRENVAVVVAERPESSFDIRAVACSWPYCDKPLRGATGIHGLSSGKRCTGGFFVRSVSNNKPYLLTAGHCFYGFGAEWWYTFNSVLGRRY